MSEKYKYMFLKYIYEKLDLKSIESNVEQQGINFLDYKIEGLFPEISKYFNLANSVDDSRLSPDLKEKYNDYFSLPIETLNEEKNRNEIFDFLEKTYKLMLFPNIEENFCFYGPINYNYVAPRDCVVLGFNYYEFDIEENNFDKIYENREEFICDQLNYIQEVLSEKAGINVAVLKYNEFVKKNADFEIKGRGR